MQKILSTLTTAMLLCLPMLAAAQEREAPSVPSETVSTVYVAVFGVIFVGMIIGFFIYLFVSDKKQGTEQK